MCNFNEAKETVDKILEQFKDTDFFRYLSFIEDWKTMPLRDKSYYDIRTKNYIHRRVPCSSLYEYFSYYLDDNPKFDNIHRFCGATRMVFHDENNPDYVIKIAIDCDDEKYNEKEVEIYNDAVECGVEDAFGYMTCIYPVGTKLFGKYVLTKGIYAMETLDCDEDLITSDALDNEWLNYCRDNGIDVNDSQAREDFDYDYEYDDFNDVVWEYAETTWVDWLVEGMENFRETHLLEDIHAANVGYRSGGNKVVLADYGGYAWGQE